MPERIGPKVSAPPVSLSSLQAMLQDCQIREDQNVGSALQDENGNAASIFLPLTAMSACTSPSMTRVGSA